MKYVKLRVNKGGTIEERQYGGIDSVAAKGPKANDPFIGFTENSSMLKDDVVITPEGDAVLNIYFDRMKYDVKMYVTRKSTTGNSYRGSHIQGRTFSGDWAYDLSGITKIKGSAPTAFDTVGNFEYYYYTFTAYYGDDISGSWPGYDDVEVINNTRYFISWLLMKNAKAYTGDSNGKDTVKGDITVLDEMILGDLTHSGGNYLTARYDGEPFTWTYKIFFADDKGNYPAEPNETITAKSNQSGEFSQHNPAIEGYEYVKQDNYKADLVTRICEVSFYYKPLQYPIRFMDGEYFDGDLKGSFNRANNMLFAATDITYGANIEEALAKHAAEFDKDNPTCPEPGYVFDGWYVDEGCLGEKFDFDSKMPMGTVTVYAKWIIVQYRVFLHPNAYLDDEKTQKDPSLHWGDDSVSMCFRVDYNGTISTPTGTRDNYVFVGWYFDEDCSHDQVFTAEGYKLNESTVHEDYDKYTHYTDEMDKWGEGATWNADLEVTSGEKPHPERTWITKEFNIYAKWRKVLDGADGINVVYDIEDNDLDNDPSTTDPGKGTGKAEDDGLYVDKAPVSAAPAVKAPEGYQFDRWVIQKYDKTADKYVDTDKTVFPGETFNVLADNAKVTLQSDGVHKLYIVQLRAEYKPIEDPTPTYIPWYNNDGTEAFHIDTLLPSGVSDLGINESVIIQNPVYTTERARYEFKGWARVNMGTSDQAAKDFMADSNNWKKDVTVNFLHYKDGMYYPDATVGNPSKEAKKIAADEVMPYQALFAVWEELPLYKVEYEISGDIPDGISAPVDSNVYAAGETVTVLSVADYPEGYEFAGWTTKDVDGIEKTYAATGNFQMPANDVTLHGVFTLKKYKVTFSYDGSEPSGFTPPDAITNVEFKSPVDVNTQTAAVEAAANAVGYKFLGWTPKESDVTLSNDKFNMPAHDVELIGKFELRDDVKYIVEHYYEDETGGFPATPKYSEEKNDGKTGDTLNVLLLLKEEGDYTHDASKDQYISGTTILDKPVVQGDGSLVIKLYYVLLEYNVTYDYDDTAPSNASTLPTTKPYKASVNVKYEPEATAEGYEFLGWKVQGEDITPTEDGFKMPARDVLVIGSFRQLEYKVSYEFDTSKPAADITEPGDQTGIHYQEPVTTTDATKFVDDQKDKFKGYTFVGWKVKEGLPPQEETVTSFSMPANDVVLIGSFVTNKDVEYKVEYYFEKADKAGEYEHNTALDATKGDGETGKDLTAEQLDNLKTTFAEFTYEKMEYEASTGALTNPTVQADGSLVVKLYYVRKKFKVTYKYIGFVPTDATPLPGQEDYRAGATVEVAKDATANGYTFSGWSGNYQEEVSGSLIDKLLDIITGGSGKYFTMPAADVIIVGSFKATEYEVSYKIVSDEIPAGIEVPATKSYAFNSDVYVESELAAKGYAFAGWVSKTVSPEGGKFKMPNENVEFIGVFDPITYEITFEYRVATGVTPPSNLAALQNAVKAYNGTFRAGEDIPLPTRPTISGYVFTAWRMEEVPNEEGNSPLERAIKRAKDLLALKVSAAEETMVCKEYDAVIYSVITASTTPPDPPTPNPDPPTPTPTPGPTPTPDPTPTPVPVTVVPAGQAVLGARREEGNGQAVLGARRGRTDDETNSPARAFAILVSAAAAISLMFVGRKKEEEDEG